MTRMLFVMIDGARPDAVQGANCPTLQQMIRDGASTMHARSVMPSVTLPCHMSIFHSVPPTRHGVTVNAFMPMARPVPGLVDVATDAGKRCVFFHNWEPLRDLSRPEKLYFSWFRDSSRSEDGDDVTVDEVCRYVDAARTTRPVDMPDFLFVYLGTVDTAGHVHGWMKDGYIRQLERIDRAFGRLLSAMPDDISVLVHSDHGGHARDHGTDSAEDMTIPWIARGPGIRRGHTITAPVSLLDTAPTIARVLGVRAHRDWEGAPPEEMFEPPANAANASSAG